MLSGPAKFALIVAIGVMVILALIILGAVAPILLLGVIVVILIMLIP